MAKLRLKSGKEINIEAIGDENGVLIAVTDGNQIISSAGRVIRFKPSGYIHRIESVGDDLGLKVNDLGKVRMVK